MDKMERPPSDQELRRRINELIAYKGGGSNPDLVADIVENALKLLTDVESRGDVRVIQTTVRELRYAFRLFAPHAKVRKVTMFGSARLQPSRKEYQEAVTFARRIADQGWMVITGAGPGIMQAGHEGAGPERSFGANIRLPWEQSANPVIQHDKKLITFKYFFTRKLTFVRHSDAIVLFPGGFGTMDELFEALTLIQTRKIRNFPVVLFGSQYWQGLLQWITSTMLHEKYINPEDLSLIHLTDSPRDAVDFIISTCYAGVDSKKS